MQLAPTVPGLHVHRPFTSQVPLPLHVVAAWQKRQIGNA